MPVLVRVAAVEKRDIPITLKQVGTVVTSDSVAVRSRIDSQIAEVRFKDGDYVDQGDVLFVLDDRWLRAKLAQMRANVERDQAALANEHAQYERSKELTKKDFESKASLDTAKAAYEAARANVSASQAEMENIQAQLEYTRDRKSVV